MSNIVFAIVVEGEVAGTLVYPETSEKPATLLRHVAALQSDPKIIDVTGQSVETGWTYDGVQFNPPAN